MSGVTVEASTRVGMVTWDSITGCGTLESEVMMVGMEASATGASASSAFGSASSSMSGTIVWKSNRSGIIGSISGSDLVSTAGVGMGTGAGCTGWAFTGSTGTRVSRGAASGTRVASVAGEKVLILSSRSPAMMTIKWVAYRSATGGMLMMTGGTHDGSRNPVLIIACNALPAMEKPLNRTSPTHG